MLTSAQLATLKTYIQATPALNALYTEGNMGGLADALNADHAPAFIIWRTEYTPELKAKAIDVGITQLDALTASKRDSLLWWANRTHNASLANTQAAMSDLCGSQNMLKTALIDGAKRSATVAEKALASGTGTTASPGMPTFTGEVAWSELIGM